MASQAVFDPQAGQGPGRRWMDAYRSGAPVGDVLTGAQVADLPAWTTLFEELGDLPGDRPLVAAAERARRHAEDIGTGYRIPGETDERRWPLSPVPLLIGEAEWDAIAAGVAQRAHLMELVLRDIHGPASLIADGTIPAALVTGSPWFLRPMVGLTPPGGSQLHFIAVDLGRDPGGQWRVLADHLRAPAGAGYALENRLAMARTLGGLQSRLNIRRHAPFFAGLREGIAAACRRSEPRIGLLTPGRFNASYAEQAHLARYLGFLLVEGADLSVRGDQLYVRTIAGLKRIDALWRRVDASLLDPLAFDSRSRIGVPGLVDAMAAGNVVIANAPGVGVLEAPAFAAFMPAIARRLLGEKLALPGVATWWAGQPREQAHVRAAIDMLEVAPAFGNATLALAQGVLGAALSGEARARLLDDLTHRPQDYVGREAVRLSTMPVIADGTVAPRPFTLRVFAARDGSGAWTVLPGGFVRIGAEADARAALLGEGNWSADVCVHGPDPVAPISLLPAPETVEIRRNPGTLPSRVADNQFWLGRYLERGEALLTAIRVLMGHSIGADTGAALAVETVERLVGLIVATGAAPPPASLRRADLAAFARTAMEDPAGLNSVRAINRHAAAIGAVSRDRLSADMIRLLDAPHPDKGGMLDRAGTLQRRYAALAGLSAEHMARTDAWRFHDLGRRIERGIAIVRAVRMCAGEGATAEDLSTLLDLADSQISYRQRYLASFARAAVVDLVLLDPGNPRALAFQVACIAEHLARLPVLSDAGVAEEQQAIATSLSATVATTPAAAVDGAMLANVEATLARLSNAVARRYFMHGAEALRSSNLTLA